MMLPLCTRVTDLRSLSMAYLMAPAPGAGALDRHRLDADAGGLGKRIFLTPISSCRNLMTFFSAIRIGRAHSMPA